jgi:D-alanine-D-alanine ligase
VTKKYNILLLAGGDSAERDVSLSSAKNILEALEALGHRVNVADPQDPQLPPKETRKMVLSAGIAETPPAAKEGGGRSAFLALLGKWKDSGLDIVFNALHGGAGEDGTIQAMLEYLDIPFTGSGATACALAMDKSIGKNLCSRAGVPVSDGFSIDTRDVPVAALKEKIADYPGFPAVVKPNNQGSSVGVTVVRTPGEVDDAVAKTERFGHTLVVEKYIAGSEITVSVLGKRALPVLEIKPKSGLYDYLHKYTAGASEYIVPAPLDDALAGSFAGHAVTAFQTLGCCVYGRVDFRLSEKNEPVMLEVNTLPGMTRRSLVPKAAKAAGVEFPELVEQILHLSLQEVRQKH